MRKRIILILVVLGVVAGLTGGIWWYVRRSTGWRLLARAQVAMQAGNSKEAAELAGRYISKYPSDWQGYHWQARAYTRLGRYPEARERLNKVLAEAAAGRMKVDEVDCRLLLASTYADAARRALSAPDAYKQPAVLKSAIEQFGMANQELEKIKVEDATRALDVHEPAGRNWIDIGNARRQLAELHGQSAKTAQAAGDMSKHDAEKAAGKTELAEAEKAFDKATAELMTVVMKAPSRGTAANPLVQLCMDRNDTKSLAVAREAIMSLEDPPPLAAMLLATEELGETARSEDPTGNREKLQKACRVLDDIIKRHPDVNQVKVARARLALVQGDDPHAERLCKEVLEKDPRNGLARLIRAELMSRRGDLAGAEGELFALKPDFPRWAEAHAAYARAALASGKQELARTAWRDVTKIDPNHPVARRYLAESLLKDGLPEEAFKDAKVYYEAWPGDPAAIRLYVVLAKRTDQPTLATDALEKALKDYRDRPDVLMAVAEGYAVLGDNEKAAKALRDASDVKPTTTKARLAVARALMLTDRVAEAERILDAQLAEKPGLPQPEVCFELGRLYARTGRTLQAVEKYRTAVQQDSANPAYKLALARALFESGELEECSSTLEGLSPSDPEVGYLRLQLQLARGEAPGGEEILGQIAAAGRSGLPVAVAYMRSGRPGQCVDICLAELKKTPEQSQLRALLGQAYLALGQRAKGIEQLKLALKSAPAQPSVYRDLAQVLAPGADIEKVAKELHAVPNARAEMVGMACGWLLERQRKFPEAADVYGKLAEHGSTPEPSRNRARLYRARSLASAGQVDQALAELDRLAGDEALRKEVERHRAELLIGTKRFPEAQAALAKMRADAVKQKDADVLGRVIPLYARMERFDDALGGCDDLEKLRPNDPRTFLLRGSVLLAYGKTDEAVNAYGKAVEKQPGNIMLYLRLAGVLDAAQRPSEALQALDRLAALGKTGEAVALFHRGGMLARWGLQSQAVKCLEQLAGLGYSTSPRFRLQLGRSLARLGQKDRAAGVLEEIPLHAAEYVASRQILANMAQDTDAKLSILRDLDVARPGRAGVLTQQLAVLLEANRPSDAVKLFQDFAEKLGKDRPLPLTASHLAVRTMLDVGEHKAAEELALRIHTQTRHPLWRKLAALVILDEKPKDAEALLPDAAQADLQDALVGLCAAVRAGDAQAVKKWGTRLEQIDEQGKRADPPRPVAAAYKVLVALARGDAEKARLALAELKAAGGMDGIVAAELVSSAEGNPKTAEEAITLLKASVAGEVGLASAGASWALDLLKSRPTCQWAAAVVMSARPDAGTWRNIGKTLEPKDCALHKAVDALVLVTEGQHEQAAKLLAEAAQAGLTGPTLILQRANALEQAGRLPEALKLYRQSWDSSKNPYAGNNAAYLMTRLYPEDPAKLGDAQAIMEGALKNVPGAPAFRDTLGWILHLRGDKGGACVELRRAVKGLPDSPEVHCHLGLAEVAAGNRAMGAWHLEAAVHLGERLKAEGKNTKAHDEAVARAREALKQVGQASS
ncbi:MAG TPA: tetratricopeptide repeat protein [Phycisphaerae bacterium]|nr:tetratricopeptide repeat protein [Phycisphaerae bacterium]HUT57787.1 tetratricopeptide repeat protein [Phycisphaerae bacterium]